MIYYHFLLALLRMDLQKISWAFLSRLQCSLNYLTTPKSDHGCMYKNPKNHLNLNLLSLRATICEVKMNFMMNFQFFKAYLMSDTHMNFCPIRKMVHVWKEHNSVANVSIWSTNYSEVSIKRTHSIKRPHFGEFKKSLLNVPYDLI